MDILKVQFEQPVPRITDLNAFEPISEDFYRQTLEIITKLQEEEGADVYVLPTLYSAYQISRASMGEQKIRTAARETPDLYKAVLESYKNALIWLVKECKKVGIQGFYMCTQGGEMTFYDIPAKSSILRTIWPVAARTIPANVKMNICPAPASVR